jgi:hypothetical protein
MKVPAWCTIDQNQASCTKSNVTRDEQEPNDKPVSMKKSWQRLIT